MKKQCPECKKMFFGNECECGFRISFTDESQRGPVNCQHINKNGLRCQLSGTVSPHIPSSTKDYPKFYCGYHMTIGYNNEPNKDKFTNWLLSGDKRLLDSSFDWIDYLWKRASGVSALELKEPSRAAYDYLKDDKSFDKNGLTIIKETMPKIWNILILKYPHIEEAINEKTPIW